MAVTYSQNGVIVRNGGSVYGSVTIAGRAYKTIIIGNLEILAENLDEEFAGITHQNAVETSTPSCCYFNNGNAETYGREGTYKLGLLYNGYAANYIENNKNDLLPSGWGIMTVDTYAGLTLSTGFTGINAGKSISTGPLDWAPSWNGTDIIHFNSKPGGNWNVGLGFVNFSTGVRYMTTNPSRQFYYNIPGNVYELPTSDGPANYSYIRLFRMIE